MWFKQDPDLLFMECILTHTTHTLISQTASLPWTWPFCSPLYRQLYSRATLHPEGAHGLESKLHHIAALRGELVAAALEALLIVDNDLLEKRGRVKTEFCKHAPWPKSLWQISLKTCQGGSVIAPTSFNRFNKAEGSHNVQTLYWGKWLKLEETCELYKLPQ